jgi:hypothetical protein
VVPSIINQQHSINKINWHTKLAVHMNHAPLVAVANQAALHRAFAAKCGLATIIQRSSSSLGGI